MGVRCFGLVNVVVCLGLSSLDNGVGAPTFNPLGGVYVFSLSVTFGASGGW